MNTLHAKPIINNKFWIVEKDGEKFATLRRCENNVYILSTQTGSTTYHNDTAIKKLFGEEFFTVRIVKPADTALPKEVHGYPTSVLPHNPMYNVRDRLPVFTKSEDSQTMYCAGYYIIQFKNGWVKSFCPKLITLRKYNYRGPYKTEFESRQAIANEKR